jgi:hypothetical protein
LTFDRLRRQLPSAVMGLSHRLGRGVAMIGRLCLAAVAALATSITMIDAPSAREITSEISADAFYFYFGENIGSVDFKFQVNTEDIQEFDGNLSFLFSAPNAL